MHTILETDTFAGSAKRIGLTEAERLEVTLAISANPKLGDLIQGTGGARKARFGRGNKGKSGGTRVISFYAAEDVPVFLLDVYAKGERVDLSQQERNELRKILAGIASDYRASTAASRSKAQETAN